MVKKRKSLKKRRSIFTYARKHKLKFSAAVLIIGAAAVGAGTFGFQQLTSASYVSFYEKSTTTNGYTLVAPTKSNSVYLVNNNGNTVHTWKTDSNPGLDTKLLENGQLFRTYDVENKNFPMGGQGGGLQLINWDGSIAWDYRYSSDNYVLHHDAMMMPNGHVLASAWVKIPGKKALAAGVDPQNIDTKTDSVWSNEIIEINPKTNRIVWRWKAFDHLIQDYDKTKDNYGKVNKHPRKIDANYYKYVTKPDWLHVNSVDYNPKTDQVMISVREFNELWVIDHSTNFKQASSTSGGKYGHGGDLLYRYGNPEAYGQGNEKDRSLFLQHDTQWIKNKKTPGYGNVTAFNNGDKKHSGQPYTSAIEISLPQKADGSYKMKNRFKFETADLVWQYAPTGDDQFYSQYMGGVQRLPNGNTLIADAMGSRIIEVKHDGSTAWSYINKHTDGKKSETKLFRAYKYESSYSGLKDLPTQNETRQ